MRQSITFSYSKDRSITVCCELGCDNYWVAVHDPQIEYVAGWPTAMMEKHGDGLIQINFTRSQAESLILALQKVLLKETI